MANTSWVQGLILYDNAWKGNANLEFSETRANVGYYNANSNTVYVSNISNTANYLWPHSEFENYENVYTQRSNIIFQFQDYEWTIYYEPRLYTNGNVTIVCVGECCLSCGNTIDNCNCYGVPESKGGGFQPGDIIYQNVPEIISDVELTLNEYALYLEETGQCIGCLSDAVVADYMANPAKRTVKRVTQKAQYITAEVIEENIPGLSINVRYSTGRFVPGYPIGKVGEPPQVVVNIVYLEYDYAGIRTGYIIQEPGMFKADCYFPCSPKMFDPTDCVNLGPLEDAPVWNIYLEADPNSNIDDIEPSDDYYIVPNPASGLDTDIFAPLTPIGYMNETWTSAGEQYISIGMNVVIANNINIV